MTEIMNSEILMGNNSNSIEKIDSLGLANSVPDFVKKLFRILEDDSYHKIIFWSDLGDSFIVRDQSELSKHVLPQHFKHNNFASFVRQLNKYDFHKMKSTEEKKRYGENIWEFKHPYFRHNRHDLLDRIKRKPPLKSRGNGLHLMPMNMNGGASPSGISETEFYSTTEDLQNQVQLLTKANTQVSKYLNQLSTYYQQMNEEVVNIKKSIQIQDQLMAEFVQYVFNSDAKKHI
ncbi:Transcription factor prr1 [Smittium culicis]|uniref:Transcription factor prr1 n=1 Tax=Smittium culicis TaxID=133412 RepID=A0A1R1XDD0_9FUNG|nr:Transcription factor prr1 [Smittium culicis]OMJ13039.1 Transcription factor prr1 [Smittium culicis]